VGTTRFEPLRKPTGLPLSTWGQLGAAFDEYSLEDRRLPWVTALPEWEHLGIHVLCCPDEAPQLGGRLLRLALLAQGREHRDSLVDSLTRRGLGASIMYGGALNRVDRIPREVALQGPFPNAELLAGRLFTLPTHRWVSAETVNRISVCLRATACEGTLC